MAECTIRHPAECATPDEWKAFALKCHDFIEMRGYRYCDIMACNCNEWHEGHADRRLQELREALGDLTQGGTILGAVEKLLESCARSYEGQ